MLKQLKDIPTLILLALMGIGFVWFWPVGLATLAYLVWSGRIGQRINISIGPWASSFWSSGNKAFDEHRQEMVAKLEEEQREFGEFLTNLANAKDRKEFDDFMASRSAKKS